MLNIHVFHSLFHIINLTFTINKARKTEKKALNHSIFHYFDNYFL